MGLFFMRLALVLTIFSCNESFEFMNLKHVFMVAIWLLMGGLLDTPLTAARLEWL